MPGRRDLPVLTNVQLRKFSLYTNRSSIDIPIRSGVFCLAGANGLGKSSFLAAINFGYTGIVTRPNRAFRGVQSYYADSLLFTRRYFDGRVTEEDRSQAEVALSFRLGNHQYSLTRNFFEPEALREFTIRTQEGEVILQTEDRSPEERHRIYRNRVTEDCRLGSFEYFAFMQHFLLTFDERRHLIFWDQRAANVALKIAFGVTPEDTVRSEELRLSVDSEESNARNAQWQATIAANRLKELGGADSAGLRELRQQHAQLLERAEAVREEAESTEQAAEDAALKATEASARQLALKREYDQIFAKRLAGQREPARHPTIRLTLNDRTCDVCGSQDPEAIERIERALEAQECPLCHSHIVPAAGEVDFAELIRVDDALADVKKELDAADARLERLQRDAAQASGVAAQAAKDLDHFESAHSEAMPAILSAGTETDRLRRELESERRNATARRDEHRRARDAYRSELEPLQKRLAVAYQEGQLDFVPNFRRLAYSFIGLDLDVFVYQQQGVYGLGVEVLGERRRAMTQVSESQRFFLEIALRMALAQHMSSTSSPAGLLIDTPEGALDIAYEARAGDMFAGFVGDGFNIIMTANINTSELLIRLAERCGGEQMQLVRMTEWTALSEVQATEEDLFDRAYQSIEEKLLPPATQNGG